MLSGSVDMLSEKKWRDDVCEARNWLSYNER